MSYEYSSWTEIKLTVKVGSLDSAVAIMSAVDPGLMIEDYSDFDLKSVYGDLVDEKILSADKTVASVSVFIPEDGDVEGTLAFIRERLAAASVEGRISTSGVKEEDFANAWRQYYKPLHIGRIVIVPKWESYEPKDGEIIIRMDPGMAFGTGSHETTRLVIGLLENCVTPGCSVLDVGCGSGILAVCASKLGAGECRAYDIDPVAVEVAGENAAENGCANVTAGRSDLLAGVEPGKYDVICANIVADIIIRMAPDIGAFMHDESTLLASGIINERAADVIDALEANGLYVSCSLEDNGWTALAVKKLID